MDCDYDPKADVKKELIENSKGRKKRKRKSLFAKAVSQPKPVFDPNDKTYEEYLDEYYKFDCEDIIGDIPCRFKYRKVVPNSFGLTVEEILIANDRELNKWCSLKKAIQHRPDHVEKYDQIAYEKKANNIALKKKILPSLFVNEKADEDNATAENIHNKKKRKTKKVRCKKGIEENGNAEDIVNSKTQNEESEETSSSNISLNRKKKQKTKRKIQETQTVETETNMEESEKNENGSPKSNVNTTPMKKKTKKKKKLVQNNNESVIKNPKKRKFPDDKNSNVAMKKSKINFKSKSNSLGISDARLSAYGINPKKFKNKLKYAKS